MAIEVVLWDFGGVFTASPFGAVHRYAAELGIDPDDLFGAVFGPYHADTDHPWHRLERGEVTLSDAMAAIADLVDGLGASFDAGRLFTLMGQSDPERRRSERAAATVARAGEWGIRQALVTNNIREFGDAWRASLDLAPFELVVDSSAEGVRKPDPAIYRLALERLGVAEPDRALFVDDLASNVEAARSLGVHGVVVGDDLDLAMTEVEQLLGG